MNKIATIVVTALALAVATTPAGAQQSGLVDKFHSASKHGGWHITCHQNGNVIADYRKISSLTETFGNGQVVRLSFLKHGEAFDYTVMNINPSVVCEYGPEKNQ